MGAGLLGRNEPVANPLSVADYAAVLDRRGGPLRARWYALRWHYSVLVGCCLRGRFERNETSSIEVRRAVVRLLQEAAKKASRLLEHDQTHGIPLWWQRARGGPS